MSAQPSQPQPSVKPNGGAGETYRIKMAFWLSIFGLSIAALIVIALLIAGFKTSNDIVGVVGLFTSILGTLVGLFFGVQIGSAGKTEAEQRAGDAQKNANALAAAATKGVVNQAQKYGWEA
jgi:hypothetical protein